MEHTNALQEKWDKFARTGMITDYLEYKQVYNASI